MSKDFWPVAQAKKIIQRLRPGQDTVIFETGYGPSGLPHIGTFAEVARANFVIMALKDLEPNLNIRLIAFSDDRDGLRKIAPNIPNQSMLKTHMGKPLTKVPDPFMISDSFAGYMNAKLREFLDTFGFQYEYFSSTEVYEKGLLDNVLRKISDNYTKIREAFIKTIHPDKRKNWSPFLPICQNCGKLYTTKVEEIDFANYTLNYSCIQNSEHYQSCGHTAKININGANIKLGWKIDWAARWYTFNVDYELHGEDLMDSVTISKEVCKILSHKSPLTFKYELFLDEEGRKISKTKGNGISIDEWLKYAPLNALLYFILSDPNKPKRMGLPIMSGLIDEYLGAEKKEASLNNQNPVWYIRRFRDYDEEEVKKFLPCHLLVNIAKSLNAKDHAILLDYSYRYQSDLIGKVGFKEFCYSSYLLAKQLQERKDLAKDNTESSYNPSYFMQLNYWREYLETQTTDNIDGTKAQTKIFELAKQADIPLAKWFKFLYNIYLQQDNGPKLGQYFALLGKDKSLELTRQALKNK